MLSHCPCCRPFLIGSDRLLPGATANRRALKTWELHATAAAGAGRYGTLRDWEWMDTGMTTDLKDEDKAQLWRMVQADCDFLQKPSRGYEERPCPGGSHTLSCAAPVAAGLARGSTLVPLRPRHKQAKLARLLTPAGYLPPHRQHPRPCEQGDLSAGPRAPMPRLRIRVARSTEGLLLWHHRRAAES